MLRCYAEFPDFAWLQVRETIECPVYMRRIPNASPMEHAEMQQALEIRREAQQARQKALKETRAASARQRRDTWIIGVLTMFVVLLGSIVAALIGRGIIFPPAG
ncbi:MAG: hypothetical protein OXG27_15970 [Chloroflexi bacterium]|nr:hypothetical protein [Chloroflexota bacterium]